MGNCLVAQIGRTDRRHQRKSRGRRASGTSSTPFSTPCLRRNPRHLEGVLEGKLDHLTDLTTHEIDLLKHARPHSGPAATNSSEATTPTSNASSMSWTPTTSTSCSTSAATIPWTPSTRFEWARANGCDKRRRHPEQSSTVRCPCRHRPCFPSAAKLACQITHATRMDYDAYTRPEVFVLSNYGRDAGWLAASRCASGDVDLLVLPRST